MHSARPWHSISGSPPPDGDRLRYLFAARRAGVYRFSLARHGEEAAIERQSDEAISRPGLHGRLTRGGRTPARYLVVGGWPTAFHGHPRFTKGLDVLIDRPRNLCRRLGEAVSTTHCETPAPRATCRFFSCTTTSFAVVRRSAEIVARPARQEWPGY